MEQRAKELTENMNNAGITPENEKTHAAYNQQYDTLSYSEDNNTPLSSNPFGPCNLHRHNGLWVMFDAHGASYIPIEWVNGKWKAGIKTRC